MEEFIKYRLTKKKSIEITIELWKWLEENPVAQKSSWPEWRKYDYMNCSCSCCEFTRRKSKAMVDGDEKNCKAYCSLYELWSYPKIECVEMPCENRKSPYAKWVRTHDPKEKSFWAREIWMGAQKLLEKK
jgi:hypothetical protein